MDREYLDKQGLTTLVSEIKSIIPTKTSEIDNDTKLVNYTELGSNPEFDFSEPLYKDIEYKDLTTTHKTIIAAINDVAKSGGGGKVEDIQVNGVSILDEEGVANIDLSTKQEKLIAGTNITIDEQTNTISASGGGSNVVVTPTLTSGAKVGDIAVDGTTKSLYISPNYLDKTSTARNYISGQVYVGTLSTNVGNAYAHLRNTSTFPDGNVTGSFYNGAAFAVSTDGSASFQHKTFTNASEGGARNAAVLRFYGTASKTGKLQFAINTGTGSVPTEAMYKDVAMVDDIPTYTAGTNIQISNDNTISATDTKYKAGKNITIDEDNTISASGGGEVPDDIVLWTTPKEGASIQLIDKDNNPIMPITTTNDVIAPDGETLEQKLQDIINYISRGIENGMEVEY